MKRGKSRGSAARKGRAALRRALAVPSGGGTPATASRSRARTFPAGKMLEFLAALAIVAYVIYALLQAKLFSASIEPSRFRDLGILFDLSRHMIETGSYGLGYYFPPSNAVLIHLFGAIGEELAFRVHLILQASAFFVTLWVWSSFIGIAQRPERMRIAFCAVLATLFYVRFEFHMHNVNLLTLGLVSLSLYWLQRPVIGGAAYAINIAIKPYGAALLLPWMLWSRQVRWTGAAAIWGLAFMVLLPVAWFGLHDAVRLFGEWIAAVESTMRDPGALSLRAGFAGLAGDDASSLGVRRATQVAQVAWLGALSVFLWPGIRHPGRAFGYAMACDIAALLIAPLPLGGWQQPARGIVLLIPMLIICAAIFDVHVSPRARAALIIVVALVGTLPRLVATPEAFALMTLVICAVLLAGLAIARNTHVEERRSDSSAFAGARVRLDYGS
jgi:hypothetical protein